MNAKKPVQAKRQVVTNSDARLRQKARTLAQNLAALKNGPSFIGHTTGPRETVATGSEQQSNSRRDRKLARLGLESSQNVRPSAPKTGAGVARISRSPLVDTAHRIYTNAEGREIARARIVTNEKDFVAAHKHVNTPTFTRDSVGIADSSVYHGSRNIQRDYVSKGVRGTRVAGSQYLDVVTTDVTVNSSDHDTAIGQRLTVCLINPSALGSILGKLSLDFEECKFNRLAVIYKPVVAATTPGALGMYFRNDVQNPMWSTGLEELSHAATHEAFQDFSVWAPARIDIDPADIMKKYWDEINGDVSAEVQGMVTVISTSGLTRNQTLGHLYLEYDCDFSAPELDYEVDEVGVAYLNLVWNAYITTLGDPMIFRFKTTAATQATANWDVLGTPPDSSEFFGYGTIVNVVTGTNGPPAWSTAEDPMANAFVKGQGFYVRMTGVGSSSFTDDSINVYLYTDLNSAMNAILDLASESYYVNDGQLVDAGTLGFATSGTITLRLRLSPLANGA